MAILYRYVFDEPVRFYSEAGSPIKITYAFKYDKEGRGILVEKGKENIYNEIQSHADSVDINVILKRFASGDTSVLNQKVGAFGDFTNVPKSYADVLNRISDAEDIFKTLPSEIRNEFNNSLAQFLAAMDQPDFNARINARIDGNSAGAVGVQTSSEGEGAVTDTK